MVAANLSTPLMVGQTGYTLTCGVTGADNLNQTITYQWTRNNGTTQTQVETNSMTLLISPLRLSDAGNYSCRIISTLLNNPVATNISQSVMIQSNYSYNNCSKSSNIYTILTVPDPQSITITSSPGTIVPNGSDVTLNCIVQINENVSPYELALLVVNASLTRPDGATLEVSNPIIEGTSFTFNTTVNSFSESDVGNYSCTATVTTRSSTFLTGMGQLMSNPIKIVIIGK